jgi:hypothetical protein
LDLAVLDRLLWCSLEKPRGRFENVNEGADSSLASGRIEIRYSLVGRSATLIKRFFSHFRGRQSGGCENVHGASGIASILFLIQPVDKSTLIELFDEAVFCFRQNLHFS